MAVTTPDWLTKHGGELRPSKDGHSWALYFAGQLQSWRAENRPAAAFIIGGADGLAPSLRDKAGFTLALGAATWPHQLVRIMLLEQIYRAATLLAGHPYHRA